MRTFEAVCDYKKDDILKNLLGSQPEKILPAQHTFATRAIIVWDAFGASAWYQTFTELYNEIKVDIRGGSFYLHKAVLPLEDIEFQYLQGHDEELIVFNRYKERFEKELPRLMQDHKNKYVAIVGDEMIIEENKENLIDKMIDEYGDITMYISKITDELEEIEMTPLFFE